MCYLWLSLEVYVGNVKLQHFYMSVKMSQNNGRRDKLNEKNIIKKTIFELLIVEQRKNFKVFFSSHSRIIIKYIIISVIYLAGVLGELICPFRNKLRLSRTLSREIYFSPQQSSSSGSSSDRRLAKALIRSAAGVEVFVRVVIYFKISMMET